MAIIIDGKAVAKEVQKQIKEEVEGLERRTGRESESREGV